MVKKLEKDVGRVTTLGQWTNIKKLRKLVHRGEEISPNIIPKTDWATQKPFNEILEKEIDKYNEQG